MNRLLQGQLRAAGERLATDRAVVEIAHAAVDAVAGIGVEDELTLHPQIGDHSRGQVLGQLVRLIRQAAAGLLDEEDPALLDRLLNVLQPHLSQGVIRVHHLRAISAGRFHHVDAHLVVPEFWSVERSHELAEDLGERVMKELGAEGEMTLHTDPCHRIYCRMCDLDDCPIRREVFTGRPRLTLEEAVQPDMPRGRP